MGTPMFTRIVNTTMVLMVMKLIMSIKRDQLMLSLLMVILDIIVMVSLAMVIFHMVMTSAKLNLDVVTQVLATIIEVIREFMDMVTTRGLLNLVIIMVMGTPMFTRIVNTTMALMVMKLIMSIKRGLLMLSLDMVILDIIVMVSLAMVIFHMALTSVKLSLAMDTLV